MREENNITKGSDEELFRWTAEHLEANKKWLQKYKSLMKEERALTNEEEK